jgi:hypothetical protein
VTALKGSQVWKAGDDGLWPKDHSTQPIRSRVNSVMQDNCRILGLPGRYKDGARGTCLLLNEHVADFTFAGRVKGRRRPSRRCLSCSPRARYFQR